MSNLKHCQKQHLLKKHQVTNYRVDRKFLWEGLKNKNKENEKHMYTNIYYFVSNKVYDVPFPHL